jgi:hypothetical protein
MTPPRWVLFALAVASALSTACGEDTCLDTSDCSESDGGGHGVAGAGGAAGTGGGPPCAEDLTLCGGSCVDTDTDLQHCGRCDQACAPAPEHGSVKCAGFIDEGACEFSCERGYVLQPPQPICVPVAE